MVIKSTGWTKGSPNSTGWTKGSAPSTDWTKGTANSTNWEDDDPSPGIVLFEDSSTILYEDATYNAGLQ